MRGGVGPHPSTESVTERIHCPGHPTVHSCDDARGHRTHQACPLHVVDSFKFCCHPARACPNVRPSGWRRALPAGRHSLRRPCNWQAALRTRGHLGFDECCQRRQQAARPNIAPDACQARDASTTFASSASRAPPSPVGGNVARAARLDSTGGHLIGPYSEARQSGGTEGVA